MQIKGINVEWTQTFEHHCMYRTKLINFSNKCDKNANAKLLEAIVGHNVHI